MTEKTADITTAAPQIWIWVCLSLSGKFFSENDKEKVPVFLQKLFCLRGLPRLVEMTGIEPVSENLSAQPSTSVVCY